QPGPAELRRVARRAPRADPGRAGRRPGVGRVRAVRFHGAGDVRLDEIDPPGPPGPGEVLIRVLACGVCGSDALEYRQGPVLIHPLEAPHPVTAHRGPLVLGHEFAGDVAAV